MSMVAVGLIPLLHLAGQLSFPVLLALVAVAGGLRGPGDGAKHAFVPALVAAPSVPLERVTGLASARGAHRLLRRCRDGRCAWSRSSARPTR